MAIRPIVTIPDPVLETPTEKVGEFDEEVKQTIKDLLDTVKGARNPEGAGLAAPQIGVSKRICIVRQYLPNPNFNAHEDDYLTKEHVLVNPKVISNSKETEIHFEGCLSIPNVYGQVERPRKIKVKALDENGEPIRISASGFFALTIQHEIDHLDGILFTTKLTGAPVTEDEFDQMIADGTDDL